MQQIKWLESEVVKYYLDHRDKYTMFWELGHFPWALATRDNLWQYHAGQTLVLNHVDYGKFTEGQLKYRRLNNNADY